MGLDSYSDRLFPAKGAPEAEILAFRDRLINRWSIERNRHLARAAMNWWYLIGRQWAELDFQAAFDGVRGAIIRDMDNPDLPRPVDNEIDGAVEAEIISLVQREWTISATPSSRDPRIKAAAQVATDITRYRLEDQKWPEKRHQHGLNFATSGTGLLYSAWDKSYSDLRTIGAPTAVYCPSCNAKFYSRDIPSDLIPLGIGGQPFASTSTIRDAEPDSDDPLVIDKQMPMARMQHCPMCSENPSELQDYEPNEDEAMSGQDIFGRPLGILEPRGTSILEVDMINEFYPQDAGVRVTPSTLRYWGRRKIRSLEWLEERAPHLVDRISPEPPSELLYDDPILGEWELLGHWSPTLDQGILDHHFNADEIVHMPSFRHPRGRYILSAKDVVIEDEDLLIEEEVEQDLPNGKSTQVKVYVPRVSLAISRFKLRPSTIFGTGLPEIGISLQNRLNGIDAQVIEQRLRMGSPNLFLPPDMWIEGPQIDSSYGAGKLFWIQPSAMFPDMKHPEQFGGELFNSDVYLERDRVKSSIQEKLGPSPVVKGQPPKNVSATSGITFLAEQDEKSRSLRESEFARGCESAFSHIMQLEWILRSDEDEYRVLGPDKAYETRQYRGNVIRGQTEISIERSPFIAKSVMRREATREAIADGLAVNDGPVARRKLLENYGLDVNINEDSDNQVDLAERTWVDWYDKNKVRVQDSFDDAAIFFHVLSTYLESEDGQRVAEEIGWDEINRMTAGWEMELDNLQALEQQSLAFYGSRLEGQEAEMALAKAEASYQDQLEAFTKQKQIYVQQLQTASLSPMNGGVPPPMAAPVPPKKPPPPISIPVLKQDRILMVWSTMLQKKGYQPRAGPDAAYTRQPQSYLQFRALVEGYKLALAPPPMPGPPGAPDAGAGPGPGMRPVDKGSSMGGGTPGPVPGTSPNAPMPGGGPH